MNNDTIPPPSADDGARTEASVVEARRFAADLMVSWNKGKTADAYLAGSYDETGFIRELSARLASPATPAARGEDAAIELYAQAFERAGDQHAADCVRAREAKRAAKVCHGVPLHMEVSLDAIRHALSRAPTLPPVGDATEAQPCAARGEADVSTLPRSLEAAAWGAAPALPPVVDVRERIAQILEPWAWEVTSYNATVARDEARDKADAICAALPFAGKAKQSIRVAALLSNDLDYLRVQCPSIAKTVEQARDILDPTQRSAKESNHG